MALQPRVQVTADVRPLGCENAEDVRIPDGAVPPRGVVADDTVLFRTDPENGALRAEVEVVRPQANDLAAQRIERVPEQQQLARRVDVRALPAPRIEGVADFHSIDAPHDVVVPSRPDDL